MSDIKGGSLYYVQVVDTGRDAELTILRFDEATTEIKKSMFAELIRDGKINPLYTYRIYSVMNGDDEFRISYCKKHHNMILTTNGSTTLSCMNCDMLKKWSHDIVSRKIKQLQF